MPVRQDMAAIPSAMFQETAIAADDMKAVTGIYDSSLGNSSQEKSGKAILAREKQGDVGTYLYVDNLAIALTHAGTILIDLIPKIYDTERSIRVLGEDKREDFVTINMVQKDGTVVNDMSVGKYDVVVSTGPSFSTQREESRESMMSFMQALPNAATVIADKVAEAMDWPGADEIAKRLRKTLPPGMVEEEEGDEPNPQLEAQKQAQQQQAQAIQMKTQMDLEKEQLELEQAKVKAESDAEMAQIDREIKLIDLEIKRRELQTPPDERVF